MKPKKEPRIEVVYSKPRVEVVYSMYNGTRQVILTPDSTRNAMERSIEDGDTYRSQLMCLLHYTFLSLLSLPDVDDGEVKKVTFTFREQESVREVTD